MPCRVPKRRFSCGAPQHLTKNPILCFYFSAVWSRANGPHYRSLGNVTVRPHPSPKPRNVDDASL